MERIFDSGNDSNYIYDDLDWIDDNNSDFDDSVQATKDRKAEITIWEVIIITTCTVIICLLVFGLVKIYQMGLVSANHIYIYLTASLIGCFLLCVTLTIGTFLSIFRTYCAQTWHLCFYVEVFKSSSLEWIGACLILTLGDLFYTLIRLTENSMDDFVSQRIFANIFTVASAVILVVINSMTEHSFDDFPNMVNSCSKPTIFLNHLDFWAVLEIAVRSIVVITMLCLIIAVAIVIKHKLKINGSIESSDNGSKIHNQSGDIEEESDCSKCQSLDGFNCTTCRKHRLDVAGVDNNGFAPDMDQTTVSWGPVTSSLSQMELARRFSHSTTLDTFVQLSPSHRQKLSVASLDCDHVLYALENFFMIDPAKIQPNMKARLSNAEQSTRLIEDETSFSKLQRRRLMSMPGIKLMSKSIKTDDDKNLQEDEKDPEKADSDKSLEDLIKKRRDVVVNKSKSFDGIVEEHEFTPGKASTSSITVEVAIHGEEHDNPPENFEQDNIVMSEDGYNRMGENNCFGNCYKEANRQKIKCESEIYTERWIFDSEGHETENVTSESKGNTLETNNHLDINKELDLLEVPSDEKQLQEIRPETLEQSQCRESINTVDGIDENTTDEGQKQLKIAEVEDAVIENLDVDDLSISKKMQTEPLSFKDLLKLMGQTTYSIMIVSLVYIVLVLVSSCYAIFIVSGGKESKKNEKKNLSENISDVGQVVAVLFYVIAFEVRFRLFKNRTRK